LKRSVVIADKTDPGFLFDFLAVSIFCPPLICARDHYYPSKLTDSDKLQLP
jgi:hypothetical protein